MCHGKSHACDTAMTRGVSQPCPEIVASVHGGMWESDFSLSIGLALPSHARADIGALPLLAAPIHPRIFPPTKQVGKGTFEVS